MNITLEEETNRKTQLEKSDFYQAKVPNVSRMGIFPPRVKLTTKKLHKKMITRRIARGITLTQRKGKKMFICAKVREIE